MQGSVQKIHLLVFLLLLSALLCGCTAGPAAVSGGASPSAGSASASSAAAGADGASSDSAAASAEEGDILITEIMPRNHATLQDQDGEFSDWVELYNNSGEDINLDGWSLTDRKKRDGIVFPAYLFPAGTRFVVFASGKNLPSDLHAPFSLSAGETLFLKDPSGKVISRVECPELEPDRSFSLQADGSWKESLYPTPWRENTSAGYDDWQESLSPAGPLQINEVLVYDPTHLLYEYTGYAHGYNPPQNGTDGSDWVELKNISSEAVSLAGWYLSDDDDNYRKASLSDLGITLQPGAVVIVRCDRLGLSLNSSNEALFLYHGDRGLVDWLPLRDIPVGGSYGRLSGRNGAFFFSSPSPGAENGTGYRRVSAAPVAATPDGVFSSSEPVLLDLQAEGAIYYTLDGTVPKTSSSPVWNGPAKVPATCIIRAFAVEPGALPSRVLTLNYYIGEQFSLPVVSLVSDDRAAFNDMYYAARKTVECTGSLSWYEDGGRFTIPCGIRMHGDTSLILRKRGMSLFFRGRYGQEELSYDLFGGGVTEFSSLLLRAGQDQNAALIRNELCENLALSASDHLIASRSRYCVLYIDGQYFGIYALSEKLNEQHYAHLKGVSRSSVEMVESSVPETSSLYTDVIEFLETHDMSLDENYQHIQYLLDVDSLIDWIFMEGYFVNTDLTYGNLRFVRSSEDDGRWHLVFYDLDATLSEPYMNHMILLHKNYGQSYHATLLFDDLMKNADFRDRFLTRAGELLSGPLSDRAVLGEIDRLAAEVAPEMPRNLQEEGRMMTSWEGAINRLRSFITENSWAEFNIKSLCRELHLTDSERIRYFGSITGS